MEFRFDVNLTEKDYLDFNMFHAMKSPYGKKGIKAFRISISGLFVAYRRYCNVCIRFFIFFADLCGSHGCRDRGIAVFHPPFLFFKHKEFDKAHA